MGCLYSRDGSLLAYYEDGVVYYDATKCRTLGTYEDGYIYEGSVIFKNCIGMYDDGIISYGTGFFTSNAVGSIIDNSIYEGNNSFAVSRIAYFTGDKNGAAAAALLSGIFNSSNEENDISNNETFNNTSDYSYTGGPISSQTIVDEILMFIHKIVFLISIIVNIALIDGFITSDDPIGHFMKISYIVGLLIIFIFNLIFPAGKFFLSLLFLSTSVTSLLYCWCADFYNLETLEVSDQIILFFIFGFALLIPNKIITGIICLFNEE